MKTSLVPALIGKIDINMAHFFFNGTFKFLFFKMWTIFRSLLNLLQ